MKIEIGMRNLGYLKMNGVPSFLGDFFVVKKKNRVSFQVHVDDLFSLIINKKLILKRSSFRTNRDGVIIRVNNYKFPSVLVTKKLKQEYNW